jgi:hypothetical protein
MGRVGRAGAEADRRAEADRDGQAATVSLVGEQAERFELLRAIDRHLVDLDRDPAPWLAKANAAKPFARRKPIAFMAEGGVEAIAETLRFLERQAFKASLERGVEKR